MWNPEQPFTERELEAGLEGETQVDKAAKHRTYDLKLYIRYAFPSPTLSSLVTFDHHNVDIIFSERIPKATLTCHKAPLIKIPK